jgi:hypothetical protein
LAADACVTWAFEAVADQPGSLVAHATATMTACGGGDLVSAVDPVAYLKELADTATRAAGQLGDQIRAATAMTLATVRASGSIFFCGNGGSAADAQHMATEYVVRYQRARRALRAIALTTDTSILTAAANDFSFDEIFSR